MIALPGPCPACGGQLSRWRSVPSSEPGLGRFELWRCGRCGSAQTAGEAVTGLHDAGSYAGGAPRLSRAAAPVLARFDARRLALLARAVEPGSRVLDAGAGRGRWVAAARAGGYDALGLEPSARGVAAAAELGVPVIAGTVEDASIEPGSIDAVSLWHVLEHLDDPGEALAAIRNWLRPGGALVLGVPNLASLQARLGGPVWFHLDVPRHRTHFTAAGVQLLLERSGFIVLRTEHLLLEHNPFGMWQSLVNRVTRQPSYLFNLLKRNAPLASIDLVATLLALPLAPVAAVLEAGAAIAGRGGTVAVLARRAR